MNQTISFRDVEKLSAYLDGQLRPSEVARLESRLKTEPELASVLRDLRRARGILRKLPQRRAPRNFTLTSKMVGQKPPLPRAYPAFRFATALATILLFITFATNFVAPRLVRTAAPFPYGVGGGGGGEPELQMETAPEEPPQEAPAPPEMAMPAPTSTLPSAEDNLRVEPTAKASQKSGIQEAPSGEAFSQPVEPDQTLQEPQANRPIKTTWQFILAGIAIASGLIAFTLRSSAIRKWRAKAK